MAVAALIDFYPLMSKNKNAISALVVVILIAGMAFFYVFNPETHSFFPRCPFLQITGYECPGCGSQRAIHHLLHFHFSDAFAHNVLMPLFVPYFLLGAYLAFCGGKERFPRFEKLFFGKCAALIVVLAILMYWVLRNML